LERPLPPNRDFNNILPGSIWLIFKQTRACFAETFFTLLRIRRIYNMLKKRYLFVIGLLLIVVLAACSGEPVEVTRVVEVPMEVEVPGETVEVEVTRVVEVMAEPETAVSVVPFETEWTNSPHNMADAEAFNHWNEDDPQEVPTNCAKCHSTPGYMDFMGVDGSEFGVVDSAAPIGTTIQCQACHNEATINHTSVVFPSGIEIMGLGDESRCMECHQGRASKFTVDQGIIDAGLDPVADLDTVSEDVATSMTAKSTILSSSTWPVTIAASIATTPTPSKSKSMNALFATPTSAAPKT
jgi:hypothetical protein